MYFSIIDKCKFCLLVIFILFGVLVQCTSEKKSIDEQQKKIQRLFEKELAKENIHNAFLAIYSPSAPVNMEFIGGTFTNGEAVSAAHPFYTASIGKTFTATAIALLCEQGALQFSDKISNYLHSEIVAGLHVFMGNDYSETITIAQLLQHTSGLPDYFEGETIDGSPNVLELVFSAPDKMWTPKEVLDFSKSKMQPLFAPGTDYHYTDTEYILLGLIVEQVSKMTLHDFLRAYFFEPLQMRHTYMHLRSAPIEKTARMAEVYASKTDVSTNISLSADWAGGGIVSTPNDLIKFHQALISGRIVSATTLKSMQNWVPESRGMEYGFGLRKITFKNLFPTLPNLTIIGHSGINGSFMFYCPELDTYITGSLNQTDEVKASVVLMVKVLSEIEKLTVAEDKNIPLQSSNSLNKTKTKKPLNQHFILL
ncbi:serine hydrolase domain-containing protein [uncultured Draconibacterium sp.]|uniref:serine hydrolase domain-containing protein n=1 Tax=uncultured Draconibacterium sp. TaxID=1573823 RepID=UPI00326014F8